MMRTYVFLVGVCLAGAWSSAADADGDAIDDAIEGWPPAAGQSNRYLADSDGDGLVDGAEDRDANGVRDPGETSTRLRDSDGDGAEDGLETRLLRTDPLDPAAPAVFLDPDEDYLGADYDPDSSVRDVDHDRYADGIEAAQLDILATLVPDQHPALGDVNTDAAVSNVDALIVQSIFLGISSPLDFATSNADPNRDGQVSNVDALLLQSYFLAMEPHLPLLPYHSPTPTRTFTPTPTVTATPTLSPTRTPTLPAANLIRNPGFEEGQGTYAGVGLYWETNDAQQHPEICSLDAGIKHAGSFSQKLAAHSEWDRGAVRQISNYNSVEAGKTYELRAWVKTEGVANPAGWYVLGLWWFHNDTWLGDVKNERQETNNYDWRELVIRAAAPANANRAGVLLTRHTDGTVWYDDVVLIRVDN